MTTIPDVPDCRIADEGVPLQLNAKDEDGVAINLSTATAITIRVRYASGASKDYSASFVTDGVDGKIVAYPPAADIVSKGICFAQAIVTLGGYVKHSHPEAFFVEENLAAPAA